MNVDGISVERALAIENASIVEGYVNGSGHLVLTSKGGTDFNAGLVIKSPQIDIFLNAGNVDSFTLPEGAKLFHAYGIGGGGGGAAGTVSGGDNASGGGGSGGGFNEIWVPVAPYLEDIEWRIEVGVGGNGGSFSGAAGGDGDSTRLTGMEGVNQRQILSIPGGRGGLAVSPVSTGEQPVAPAANMYGAAGASGRGDYATPNAAPSPIRGAGSGGGGINMGSAAIQNGGLGSGTLSGAGSTIGSSGQPTLYNMLMAGGGGGMGGGGHTTAPIARPGYDGGPYGGGGGGGAGVNLQWGAGGDGYHGILVIVTYF